MKRTNPKPKKIKEVKTLDDIVTLGWEGNYAADAGRFQAVNDYIMHQTNRDLRREASRLSSYYGMGQDCLLSSDENYDPADGLGGPLFAV
jgi:hypothetical protein